eukprot:UN28319
MTSITSLNFSYLTNLNEILLVVDKSETIHERSNIVKTWMTKTINVEQTECVPCLWYGCLLAICEIKISVRHN